MLNIILTIAATWLVGQRDIERLRKLEPRLSVQDAAEHIALAQRGEAATGVEYHFLMGWGWHETRLHLNHVQREPDGRISCGVATATPVSTEAECQAWISQGYIAAGQHLQTWFHARDRKTLRPLSRHEALIGVAGGYRLIELCRKGPVWIRPGVDTCKTPEVFDAIAGMLSGDVVPAAPNARPRKIPARRPTS